MLLENNGNGYHYLPVRIKSLWWRYGAIYLPLTLLFVFSNWALLSILKFTILFLIVCVPAFLLEYLGVYFLIEGKLLTQKFLYGGKRIIQIKNITKITKSRFGLAHSESMECFYQKDGIEKSIVITLFSREPKEVIKFITDIRAINSGIDVDSGLEKSLEKRLDKTRNWKDKIFD